MDFICGLGRQLENKYYLSLWNETIQLLIDHHYFENIGQEIEFSFFYSAFQKKDKEQMQRFFQKLSN